LLLYMNILRSQFLVSL